MGPSAGRDGTDLSPICAHEISLVAKKSLNEKALVDSNTN